MENITEKSANPLVKIGTSLKESFVELGKDLANFTQNLIVAIIIILLGILIAKVLKGMTNKVLRGIKVDEIAEKSGIKSTLAKMGIKDEISTFVPKLLGLFILVFMIKVAADTANFTDISDFLAIVFGFIPKVVTAFIIMLIGMFVGEIIQNTIYNTLDAKGVDYAGSLSKIAFGLAFIIFLTVALSQLGIETELLKDSFKIIVAGVAIALALALGLGLKGHANNIVAAVYVRDIYRQGSSIEIDGELLTIKGTGPVTTKLQKDNGEYIVIPNSELVTKQVKGKVES